MVQKYLCETLCLLCVTPCNYNTENHREDTEKRRGKIVKFQSEITQ